MPKLIVEFAAVDGDVMMVVGDREFWWTIDQFAELLEMASDCLGDAIEQRGGVLEK
jgi:hypothetical protein